MKMTSEQSGLRLREAPFLFQQTYITPVPDLTRFVATLLSPFQVREAVVSIEQIIFTPGELIWYLRGLGIACDEGQLNRAILHAENTSEAFALLECILGQWTDFAFVPSPKTFAIYADHDEFTTIFVESAEVLSSLRSEMKLNGFKEVENWTWTGPHSPGKTQGTENV